MQLNWSLVLNVLLLIGVVVAIGRLMKARRKSLMPNNYRPPIAKADNAKPFDDIIAVRKLSTDDNSEEDPASVQVQGFKEASKPTLGDDSSIAEVQESKKEEAPKLGKKNRSLMFFLLAKENKQLAGYELLQTVLAAGLRFGEGQLFHRHQKANGQGPILCSLAAATATGVFDLQNIGAFSVKGLCLFMQTSGNPSIDLERFEVMYETAQKLSEGLDTHLLDEQRKPINGDSLNHYRKELAQEELALV
ncbi:MAG: cell division protein ZipA [Proteobacteria bacterium]|nr:cell division protein ZipA [Pseudomonadota bacterium]